MQLIPYDWRLDPKFIVEHYKFKEAILHFYALTGKKIVVQTHSYGINAGYEGMLLFSKEEREKYFERFISIGGPWLGAGKPVEFLVGLGAADFKITEINIGDVMGNLPVLYTLTPKDTYHRFQHTSWIKKTLQLRDYYNRKSDVKPFKFMPEREALCNTEDFKSSMKKSSFVYQCTIGLEKYEILAKVGERIWKISEAQDFLIKHGVGNNPEQYYKLFNTYNESAFENLNVPTYIFLSDSLSTEYYSEYD